MASKLEEEWVQIPSGNMNKQISLILPFHENFLHNVISKFPSCHHIGVLIDTTPFQPEVVANRIRSQYGIQEITLYIPSCDATNKPIVYPVIPNVSYFKHIQD